MNVLKHRFLSDEDVMQVIKPTHLCDIGNQIPHCILLASIKWVKLFGLWSVFFFFFFFFFFPKISIGEEVTRGPITAYHMPSWNWGISTSNFYYLLSIINILIKKLQYYGVIGTPLNWIQSFLTDRTQYVEVNNEISSLQTI